MKLKIALAITIFLGLLAIVGAVTLTVMNSDKNSTDLVTVYETEADDPSECTSLETYDPDRNVCYVECSDDAECEELLQAIDQEYQQLLDELSNGSSATREGEPAEDTEFSAVYAVRNNEKIEYIEGDDREEFRKLWEQIAELSPNLISNSYIEEFVLYEDASDDTLAYVVDEDGNGKWQYGINYATHSQSTTAEQTSTLIHELAHIITLNKSQVLPDYETCSTYKTDEGCATVQSYLHNFVQKFWLQSEQQYSPDSFVSEYAATNPEEDIAESFAYYVVSDLPTTQSTRDKKLQFFDAYRELSSTRESMRTELTRSIVRQKRTNLN